MAEPKDITLWDFLVWAYRKQKVDVMTGRTLHGLEAKADGEERHGVSGDGVARMLSIGRLGVIVQSGGHWIGGDCHPDAEKIHDAVLELGKVDWLGALAIMQHARAGEPPERCDYQPIPRPTIADNRDDDYQRVRIDGRLVNVKIVTAEHIREPVPVYDDRGNRLVVMRHGEPVPAYQPGPWIKIEYCPIDWDPPIQIVDVTNGVYDHWMRALETLGAALVGVRFKEHRIIECEMALDDQPVVA